MIVQLVQRVFSAITPWLVVAAAVFFVLWLVVLCCKASPFAKVLNWFFFFFFLRKFIAVSVFGFLTFWGGSKGRGPLPYGSMDDLYSTLHRSVESVQPRLLPVASPDKRHQLGLFLSTALWNLFQLQVNGNFTPIPLTQIMSEMFCLTLHFRRLNDEKNWNVNTYGCCAAYVYNGWGRATS